LGGHVVLSLNRLVPTDRANRRPGCHDSRTPEEIKQLDAAAEYN